MPLYVGTGLGIWVVVDYEKKTVHLEDRDHKTIKVGNSANVQALIEVLQSVMNRELKVENE